MDIIGEGVLRGVSPLRLVSLNNNGVNEMDMVITIFDKEGKELDSYNSRADTVLEALTKAVERLENSTYYQTMEDNWHEVSVSVYRGDENAR